MRFTPLDIRQQPFRKTMWGLDPSEVDAFLDVLAHDFERVLREMHVLRDEAARKDTELREYRERERTLKETMISATRITEDIKQNARKEAEIVIATAEAQAEQIIQNAHTRLVRIMEDLDELRRQKAQFEATLRSTITAHGKLVDAMSERDAPAEAEMLSFVQRRGQSTNQDAKVVNLADPMSHRLPAEPGLLTPRGGDR